MQDDVDVKVVVAGLSTTCSQKIHNQLVCNFTDIYFDSPFKYKVQLYLQFHTFI
jgi:hypothetical protein